MNTLYEGKFPTGPHSTGTKTAKRAKKCVPDPDEAATRKGSMEGRKGGRARKE